MSIAQTLPAGIQYLVWEFLSCMYWIQRRQQTHICSCPQEPKAIPLLLPASRFALSISKSSFKFLAPFLRFNLQVVFSSNSASTCIGRFPLSGPFPSKLPPGSVIALYYSVCSDKVRYVHHLLEQRHSPVSSRSVAGSLILSFEVALSPASAGS